MLTLKVDREAGTHTTYVNGIPYASGALHENATLTSGSPYTIGGTNLDFAMDNLRSGTVLCATRRLRRSTALTSRESPENSLSLPLPVGKTIPAAVKQTRM